MENHRHYQLLSKLFEYPTDELVSSAKLCRYLISDHYPQTLQIFDRFFTWVLDTPLHEMEEVYTKTFHIQAICYLDLGFVIFGEDYKRGEFLVNMKSEQLNANNDCGDELPDNLANVLTLLPKMKDDSLRDEMAVRVIIPALKKMLAEFESSRIKLKTKVLRKKHKAILLEGVKNGNIYQNLLNTLLEIFEEDFGEVCFEELQPSFAMSPGGIGASACGNCSFTHTKTSKTVKT